ncbi:MAG: DUF2442 domain-containing protein [Ginsengibacter sp.]
MNPRIETVIYKSPYKLILSFTNGENKMFDISPYLTFPIYHDLIDESFCSKIKTSNGTVAWNDEIDFDPDTLYLESKPVAQLQTSEAK